jgi:hypothetical protein
VKKGENSEFVWSAAKYWGLGWWARVVYGSFDGGGYCPAILKYIRNYPLVLGVYIYSRFRSTGVVVDVVLSSSYLKSQVPSDNCSLQIPSIHGASRSSSRQNKIELLWWRQKTLNDFTNAKGGKYPEQDNQPYARLNHVRCRDMASRQH